MILLWRRLISGRHRCPLVLHIGRLARHHDGGAGVIYRRASGIQFHHSRRRAAWPAKGTESERAGIRLQYTFGHTEGYMTATLLHTGGGNLQSLEGLYLNPMLLQLGLLDQRQQLCVSLDNAQLPYLEAYNALFRTASNRALVIVQPNANFYSNTPRKHL